MWGRLLRSEVPESPAVGRRLGAPSVGATEAMV